MAKISPIRLSRRDVYGSDRNRTISCMTRVFWSVWKDKGEGHGEEG
jgi:hypothetical protein